MVEGKYFYKLSWPVFELTDNVKITLLCDYSTYYPSMVS